MVNGKDLRRLFGMFNQKYFGGGLPTYRLRSVRHMTWLGESGRCLRRRRLIEIQRALDTETATSCLLHEMAHASTNDCHAAAWKAEMMRLKREGAPLSGDDATVEMDDWSGGHVSRRYFRMAVADMLITAPQIDAKQAIRFFIQNDGGAHSVAEFLRKFPWALRTFSACKREHRELVALDRMGKATPEQQSEIARKFVMAREAKRRKSQKPAPSKEG